MIRRFLCIAISILMLFFVVGCNDSNKISGYNQDIPQTITNSGEETRLDMEQALPAPADNSENTESEYTEELLMPADKPEELPAQTIEQEKNICTLSVKCDTILMNLDNLKEEKRKLVPENGIILDEKEVEFISGESVFDVLKREMQNNKIHMEFNESPVYKTAYIEGIGNIYEFDCGDLSGWMYKVNGKAQGMGCSQYIVKVNDRIEWMYTCDMGRDLRGD